MPVLADAYKNKLQCSEFFFKKRKALTLRGGAGAVRDAGTSQ